MLDISCVNSNSEDIASKAKVSEDKSTEIQKKEGLPEKAKIITGAEQTDIYFPLLKDKRIGVLVNQTSMIGNTHLVDSMLAGGLDVKKVFAPEHGFRGQADAGELVKDQKDIKTGLPIISLYGKNKKPSQAMLADLDIILFDIQDVGARFYTYISSLSYVMDACAEKGIPIMVLDRPNPNGHYVDGPMLEQEFESFVGLHEMPIVHGLTVGEFAKMKNQEWTTKAVDLTVIPMQNYTHSSRYELPVKPSPNLPNIRSILLYPSLCLFEGTIVSVGRGTNQQFQIFGHPNIKSGQYAFTPQAGPGSKYPKHENKVCSGMDLSQISLEELYAEQQLNLTYLINAHQELKGEEFFLKNNFFNKLAGNSKLMQQLKDGLSEEQIRASWEEDLSIYKTKRKKYLLYPDYKKLKN